MNRRKDEDKKADTPPVVVPVQMREEKVEDEVHSDADSVKKFRVKASSSKELVFNKNYRGERLAEMDP